MSEMNPAYILIPVYFAVLSEAMFSRFRLGWSTRKHSRVLPGGDGKTDELLETASNTPKSMKPTTHSPPRVISTGGNVATGTIDDPESSARNNKVAGSVGRLKALLGPVNITAGFDALTEKGAKELLNLDERLMTEILDDDIRCQFLLTAFRIDPSIIRGANSEMGVIRFSYVIGRKLKETHELKGFLRILVKFYKFCLSPLVLDNVLSAVIKSEIFDLLDELPEVLGMNYNKIFNFACTRNIANVAESLIKSRKVSSSKSVLNGVLEAYSQGNEDLGNELVRLIGEHFGTDSGSVYHQILKELAEIQLGE